MENQLAVVETDMDNSIKIYQGASMLKIEEEEQKKLTASFEEKMIEIRPDGLIYLPQVFWRERLNQTFGIGQWCLVVKNSSKDEAKNKCYLQGVLMIRGCYVGEAVGEAEYHATNPLQSWATVWEAAKSDCITRCCKDLGIANELWQPKFINEWISKYAIKVWRNKTGKSKNGNDGSYQWRKKDAQPFYDEGATKQAAGKQDEKKPASAAKKAADPAQTTMYNHQVIGTPEKPVISNGAFKQALERLKSGETHLLKKVMDKYSLTKEQNNLLNEAYRVGATEAAQVA